MVSRVLVWVVLVVIGALAMPSMAAQGAADEDACTAIWQQLDDTEKEVARLSELQSEASGKADALKSAYEEVNTFNDKMRALHRMNLNNAVTSAMLSLMQEAQGFMSGGAVVDVVKWMASKAIGEAMSRTLGGPSYYTRHLGAMRSAADDLTPKLTAFNKLRSLPLDAFRKAQDGSTMGDTGAILRRGRELVAASEAAKHSLYKAYVVVKKVDEQSSQELDVLSSQRELLRARLKRCNDAQKDSGTEEREIPPDVGLNLYKPVQKGASVATVGVSGDECADFLPPLQSITEQVGEKSKELSSAVRDYREKVVELHKDLTERSREMQAARSKQALAERKSLKYAMDLTRQDALHWIEEGRYPHGASFSRILGDTQAAHNASLRYYAGTREDALALAATVPLSVETMGVSPQVDRILQLNADIDALMGNYAALRRQAPRRCRDVNGLSWPYARSVDIAEQVNGDLKSFAAVAARLQREADQAQRDKESQAKVFSANLPVVSHYFTYLKESVTQEGMARLQAARDAIGPAREFLAAEQALQKAYGALVASGALEHHIGNGGMNTYTLSAHWVDSVAAGASPKDNPCAVVRTLLEAAQSRFGPLRNAQQRAREMDSWDNYPLPSLGSNSILEHNAPSVHQQLRGLAPDVEKLKREVIAAQQRLWNSSNDVGRLSALEPGSSYVISGPGVLAGLDQTFRKHARILAARIEVVRQEAQRDLREERIVAGEAARLREALQNHQRYYDANLSCRGDDHPLNKGFAGQFEQTEVLVAKLASKPTFADAGPLIAKLRAMKSDLMVLEIGETPTYYAQRKAFDEALARVKAEFAAGRNDFRGIDRETGQTLLDTIERQLAGYPSAPQKVDDAPVRALYREFVQAYEDRDTASVLRLLADNWEGADGSTVWDVEESLDNSFRMFNEVHYAMSDLSVAPQNNGTYVVTYHSTITGRIYDMDMKHVEQGVVKEVVGKVGAKMKILRTLSGRHSLR